MTLEISSHHIIDLIKEDIRLNHLVFGLQDLGIECHPELLSLSPAIFKICGVDLEKDLGIVEDYYTLLNSTRNKTVETINEQLNKLSDDCIGKLFR